MVFGVALCGIAEYHSRGEIWPLGEVINKSPALHAPGSNIYYLISAWNSCRLITPGASFMFSDLMPEAVALAAAMVVM